MKRFHSFCITYNVTEPFPLSEQLLYSYASYLSVQGLAPQTGKSYLSALRSMQISLGLLDLGEQSSLPVLKRVQAGISRARLLKGPTTRIRLPITAHLMNRMRVSLSASSNPEKVVIWAVVCSAFFGFFRLGELLPDSVNSFNPALGLAWGDVALDNQAAPRMVQFHLKRSKCDQFGAGTDIVVGVTGAELCLVTVLLYIELRGTRPRAFFLNSSFRPVTKPWFIQKVREFLNSVGAPHLQFASHSFRIGAATTAAMVGVEDSMIQTLGRWHSAAFLQYIRTPKECLAALSATLARANTTHP